MAAVIGLVSFRHLNRKLVERYGAIGSRGDAGAAQITRNLAVIGAVFFLYLSGVVPGAG